MVSTHIRRSVSNLRQVSTSRTSLLQLLLRLQDLGHIDFSNLQALPILDPLLNIRPRSDRCDALGIDIIVALCVVFCISLSVVLQFLNQ